MSERDRIIHAFIEALERSGKYLGQDITGYRAREALEEALEELGIND